MINTRVKNDVPNIRIGNITSNSRLKNDIPNLRIANTVTNARISAFQTAGGTTNKVSPGMVIGLLLSLTYASTSSSFVGIGDIRPNIRIKSD